MGLLCTHVCTFISCLKYTHVVLAFVSLSLCLVSLSIYASRPQVCRCAGQPSSELVTACMENRTPAGDGGGMSMSSTLFLLMMVVGAMTAGGFVHYKRTQMQMRDQVCVCVYV